MDCLTPADTSKCQEPLVQLHIVTSQKIGILSNNAARNLNLAQGILSSYCKWSNGCTTLSCKRQQHLLFPFIERYGRSGLNMYFSFLRWEGFIITSIWLWLCNCFLTPGRGRIFPFCYTHCTSSAGGHLLTSEHQLHDCSHSIKLIIQLL